MKKIIAVFALSVLFFVPMKAQELLNYPLDTINGEEVYKYRVEKSIGLYRIGVNFNVSQNEIIRLNPQLRERGLHYDEVLYIPTGRPVTAQAKKEEPKEEETAKTVEEPKQQAEEKPFIAPPVVVVRPASEPEEPIAPEEPETSENQETPTTVEEPIVYDSIVDGRRVVEYALMLPFESQQTKRSTNATRMLEFYQGALLALHDMQNDSTMYRLRVYDVERSDRRIKELCDSTELDHVNGVLGLVYPAQIEMMAKWCDAHNIPLLLPFTDNASLAKHPKILQFYSTDKQEADSLCHWIAQKSADSLHCVGIEVREADMSQPIIELRKAMQSQGLSFDTLQMRDLLNDSAEYAFDIEKENLVIVHSDRFQHMRILLPHLTKLQDAGYRLRLVSQYSWQKETISMPQVYTTVFSSDMSREEYDYLWSQFYVNEHISEMPRYDLLGYDLMRTLIEWQRGNYEYIGLQSIIRWQQDGEGGWQNAEVQVIEK